MITTYLVIQDCQFTDELVGNLWYIRTLGEKTSGREQQGLFLIRSVLPEDAKPEDFRQSDIDAFEAWWQLGLVFDAPWEDKLRTFRDTGVLWMDNDQLSLLLPPHLLVNNPAAVKVWNSFYPIADYYAQHADRPDLLADAFMAYRAFTNTSTQLLADYLETYCEGETYRSLMDEMWYRIRELYVLRLAPRMEQMTEYTLLFGLELATNRKQPWWQSERIAALREEALPQMPFSWGFYTISDAILGYMMAKFILNFKPVDDAYLCLQRVCRDPLPLPERLQLWELYYRVHRDRICERLNLDDHRTTLPTEDEIRKALLEEELARQSKSESARISTYAQQFYEFLGYASENGNDNENHNENHNHNVNDNDNGNKIPPECEKAVPRVLNFCFHKPNGEALRVRDMMLEAVEKVDTTSPVQLALLLMVARETGLVKPKTQPTAFVRMLVGIEAMPVIKDEKEERKLTIVMSKKIKGQKVGNRMIAALPEKHANWPNRNDRELGEILFKILDPTQRK